MFLDDFIMFKGEQERKRNILTLSRKMLLSISLSSNVRKHLINCRRLMRSNSDVYLSLGMLKYNAVFPLKVSV